MTDTEMQATKQRIPMRSIFCFLVLVIFPAAVFAEQSFYEETLANPAFTAELCSEGPPERLLSRLGAEGEKRVYVNFSEAGIDRFFEAYQTRLAELTDKKFPAAKDVRKSIQNAFNEIHGAMVTAYGGSGAHYHERLPGQVEWMLYHGFSDDFSTDAIYSSDHIRRAVNLFVEAHTPPEERRKEISNHLDAGLKHLEVIDVTLSPRATVYFRVTLMKMIGELYGLELSYSVEPRA